MHRGGTAQAWEITVDDAHPSAPECSVVRDGAEPAWGPCTTATRHVARGLAHGRYRFDARTSDLAGHATQATPRRFVVDGVAPRTLIRTGPPRVVRMRTARARVAFVLAGSEAGSRFRCRLDRGAWRACSAAPRYLVGAGSHVLRVRAVDRVGNADLTPAVRAFRVVRIR